MLKLTILNATKGDYNVLGILLKVYINSSEEIESDAMLLNSRLILMSWPKNTI